MQKLIKKQKTYQELSRNTIFLEKIHLNHLINLTREASKTMEDTEIIVRDFFSNYDTTNEISKTLIEKVKEFEEKNKKEILPDVDELLKHFTVYITLLTKGKRYIIERKEDNTYTINTFFKKTLVDITLKVLEKNIFNWGRVVSLFTFYRILLSELIATASRFNGFYYNEKLNELTASQSNDFTEKFNEIYIKTIIDIVNEHVFPLIKKNGGWESIIKAFEKKNESLFETIKKIIL